MKARVSVLTRLLVRMPAKLAPDAASRARHEHRPIVEYRADVFRLQFNGFASQEVLNRHRPELADFDLACRQLLQRGHGFECEVRPLQDSHDLADAFGGGVADWRECSRP